MVMATEPTVPGGAGRAIVRVERADGRRVEFAYHRRRCGDSLGVKSYAVDGEPEGPAVHVLVSELPALLFAVAAVERLAHDARTAAGYE